MRVDFATSAAARQALDTLGRTEDIRFSPGNRRLAIAGFAQHRICVFDVERGDALSLQGLVEITSSHLDHPHGLDFIDDDTLIVANRHGNLVIFHLPGPEVEGVPRVAEVSTVLKAHDKFHLRNPGSVCARALDEGRCELLVCNNYVHTVSKHRLRVAGDCQLESSELLLRRRLDIPDGVAVSADGRWIAVSNHEVHAVYLYENTPSLGPESEPDGILRLVCYPHGLRFSQDGQSIYVADAGAPYVRVYDHGGAGWWGVRQPALNLPVMGEDIYLKGGHNPKEGGPKGIDLSCDGKLLVVTSEWQPLAVFDVNLARGHHPSLEQARTLAAEQVALELLLQDEQHTHLQAMRQSLSWRITAPLRRLADAWQGKLARLRSKFPQF